jgi:hypothetical protein
VNQHQSKPSTTLDRPALLLILLRLAPPVPVPEE